MHHLYVHLVVCYASINIMYTCDDGKACTQSCVRLKSRQLYHCSTQSVIFMATEEKGVLNIKVVLLGQTSVGKSSLGRRFEHTI